MKGKVWSYSPSKQLACRCTKTRLLQPRGTSPEDHANLCLHLCFLAFWDIFLFLPSQRPTKTHLLSRLRSFCRNDFPCRRLQSTAPADGATDVKLNTESRTTPKLGDLQLFQRFQDCFLHCFYWCPFGIIVPTLKPQEALPSSCSPKSEGSGHTGCGGFDSSTRLDSTARRRKRR